MLTHLPARLSPWVKQFGAPSLIINLYLVPRLRKVWGFCHASRVLLPNLSGPDSKAGYSVWYVRWREWNWARNFSEFLFFPCQYHSTSAPQSFVPYRRYDTSAISCVWMTDLKTGRTMFLLSHRLCGLRKDNFTLPHQCLLVSYCVLVPPWVCHRIKV